MKKILSSMLLVSAYLGAWAGPLDDARGLVKEGHSSEARKKLAEALKANPRLSQNAEYNYLLGVCEFDEENYDEATKLLKAAKGKGYGPSNLYLGRLSFLDYDFEGASEFYGEFRRYRERLGQEGGEVLDDLERQLEIAESALSRVEDVEVLDSIAVDQLDFFKNYKLPTSSGRLLRPDEMPVDDRLGVEMAFINEGGDFLMWAEPDSIGNPHLMESLRLTDGEWQEPVSTPSVLGGGKFANYPFMMPDGVTLYYASNGRDSMGGYDIFVASRDAATGEYLQPQNLGMPFNSPYDDFMLAIDEENGVGWWATDRNRLDGKVTIYIYKVNQFRKNRNPDDDDILTFARLDNYRVTQNPENKEEYEALMTTVNNIDSDAPGKRVDFMFPIGGGRYYHTLSDFQNAAAYEAMKVYLKAEKSEKSLEKKLAGLRQRYPVNKADNVREEILSLEKEIDKKRTELTKLRSNVYRCLKDKR